MVIYLSLLLLAVLVAFAWYAYKIRRFVRELVDSVRLKRRMLVNESWPPLRRLGLNQLVHATNELIDHSEHCTNVEAGGANQLAATLGSIQEAVLIFNDQHVIEFVNESAKHLFQCGRSLKGARLESALRSSSLLEFVEAYRCNSSAQLQQISLEHAGEVLWFEANCAKVAGVIDVDTVSTLLVLHDITRLKSLELVRRDFVANVSHELRTPLTIIKGFAETLVEDNATLPAETRARFLDKIVNSTQRLHILVEDLLVLSRLESKPDQIAPAVQSLRQLLEETIDNNRPFLRPEVQSMVLDFDPRVGEFAFDRFRIQQVVDNLVENAFRYAPEFSCLRLTTRYDECSEMVVCTIADDGPGIPVKDVPHIFERFYCVDKGRSRNSGGTGLGLSIVKHIVLQHGGSVAANSELGKGTEMHFSLPYEQPTQGE
jgi:signal transduction histidine kinase